MKFNQPLIEATILKRYKRFLSDIELSTGEVICAHVPNTGSMTSCWEKGWKVYLSESDNPKRKLKYTLELTDNGESLISVNTSLTNKIVMEALETKAIEEVSDYEQIKAEKKVLDSRIDFYLTSDGKPDLYLEVKNVTLKTDQDLVQFPDAVSTRGQKHLKDLIELKKQGNRAVMLYVVNREDAKMFTPADHIDPEYGKLLREANAAGVEILAYQSKLSPNEIKLSNKIPIGL